MLKNKGSKSSSTRKTIRLDKKQFLIMMVITPFFAAYVSILTMMAIFQPWKANTTEPIEVPVLGDVEDKTETEKTIVITEVVEKEVEKKVESSATATAIQNSLFIQPKDIKQSTTPSETKSTQSKKTETKTSEPAKTEKPKEEKKSETPAEKPAEKSAEEIAKEACEATPSNYTTYITVHFFDIFERIYLKALGIEKENPVVDYKKYVVKNGETAKMIYQNGVCVPSKADLELVDDPILEDADLETYNINAKTDYEIWL